VLERISFYRPRKSSSVMFSNGGNKWMVLEAEDRLYASRGFLGDGLGVYVCVWFSRSS
jgi:hypothetical protein